MVGACQARKVIAREPKRRQNICLFVGSTGSDHVLTSGMANRCNKRQDHQFYAEGQDRSYRLLSEKGGAPVDSEGEKNDGLMWRQRRIRGR